VNADSPLTITRVVNSCVLLEFGTEAILTDPWFTERWHIHHGEPLGLAPEDLPALSAILVSHFFVNHWDRRALRSFREKGTRMIVPSRRMLRQARSIGFERAELGEWGSHIQISDSLDLEVVPAHRSPGGRVNNYVIRSPGVHVFFGGEAEESAPLYRYAEDAPRVDVALLPVNGLSVPFKGRIVMGPAEAVEGAEALGATVLVPIHDAHARDLPWRFIRRTGQADTAVALSASRPAGPWVVDLPTGQPWPFSPG